MAVDVGWMDRGRVMIHLPCFSVDGRRKVDVATWDYAFHVFLDFPDALLRGKSRLDVFCNGGFPLNYLFWNVKANPLEFLKWNFLRQIFFGFFANKYKGGSTYIARRNGYWGRFDCGFVGF